MYCKYCWYDVPDDTKYCPQCGKPFAENIVITGKQENKSYSESEEIFRDEPDPTSVSDEQTWAKAQLILNVIKILIATFILGPLLIASFSSFPR